MGRKLKAVASGPTKILMTIEPTTARDTQDTDVGQSPHGLCNWPSYHRQDPLAAKIPVRKLWLLFFFFF